MNHITKDEVKEDKDNIQDQILEYHHNLEGNLGDNKYIDSDPDFDHFVMEDQPDPNVDPYENADKEFIKLTT